MTEALAALDVGAEVARELIATGARCLITGDMGIGNTTASAALIACFTGRAVAEVVGRGTGIDDPMLRSQDGGDRDGAATHGGGDGLGSEPDPLDVLASLGGLEIAGLAGFIVGGAAAGVPVLIDGVIAAAALITAAALCPTAVEYCLAGHQSAEPGSRAVLEHLGLRPLSNLDLRLGEGTGACLSLPIVQTAARVLNEMATFDQAGVTHKDEHRLADRRRCMSPRLTCQNGAAQDVVASIVLLSNELVVIRRPPQEFVYASSPRPCRRSFRPGHHRVGWPRRRHLYGWHCGGIGWSPVGRGPHQGQLAQNAATQGTSENWSGYVVHARRRPRHRRVRDVHGPCGRRLPARPGLHVGRHRRRRHARSDPGRHGRGLVPVPRFWRRTTPGTSCCLAAPVQLTNCVGDANCTVNPGDQMAVKITQTGATKWTIHQTDVGHWTWTDTNIQYASHNASAEWILESPTLLVAPLELAGVGVVHFGSFASYA